MFKFIEGKENIRKNWQRLNRIVRSLISKKPQYLLSTAVFMFTIYLWIKPQVLTGNI